MWRHLSKQMNVNSSLTFFLLKIPEFKRASCVSARRLGNGIKTLQKLRDWTEMVPDWVKEHFRKAGTKNLQVS
jgi:hypothetical protein